MKTKEFIEKVSKLGYKAKQGQMGTSVYNETSCCTMAMVSEDYENRVNIYHASDDLFDTIVAYAKTYSQTLLSSNIYVSDNTI